MADIAFVICSTLNQIVNYIPIEKYTQQGDTVDIYNITIQNTNKNINTVRFNNKRWDENFEEVIKKNPENFNDKKNINKININENEILNIEKISDGIETSMNLVGKETKVIWDITGGQRSIILAINNYLSKIIKSDKEKKLENHKIVFIEGNTNQIISISAKNYIEHGGQYEHEKYETSLDFKDILLLAGFKVKGDKELNNILKSEGINYKLENSILAEENEDEEYYENIFKTLCDKVYEDKDVNFNNEIRNTLIKLNKKKGKELDKAWDTLDTLIIKENKEEKGQKDRYIDILKKVYTSKTKDSKGIYRANIFGYILESMAIYTIKKALENLEEQKIEAILQSYVIV